MDIVIYFQNFSLSTATYVANVYGGLATKYLANILTKCFLATEQVLIIILISDAPN